MYVNTPGSHERPLDGDWTGGTRIRTTTRNNFDLYYGFPTEISLPELQQGWAGIKSVYTTHGFDGFITCRAAEKLPCQADLPPTRNSSHLDWCYRSVYQDKRIGDLRMSRNLLLSRDFVDGLQDPRVWLTEGPRVEENPHYSDSIEVLFERRPDDNAIDMYNLPVCSFLQCSLPRLRPRIAITLLMKRSNTSGMSYVKTELLPLLDGFFFITIGWIALPTMILSSGSHSQPPIP